MATHFWAFYFWWHISMTKCLNVCVFKWQICVLFYKMKSPYCLATHFDVTRDTQLCRDTLFENHWSTSKNLGDHKMKKLLKIKFTFFVSSLVVNSFVVFVIAGVLALLLLIATFFNRNVLDLNPVVIFTSLKKQDRDVNNWLRSWKGWSTARKF